MSQESASRILNTLRMDMSSPANSTRQLTTSTGCWRCGDEIEFFDSPDGLCIGETSMGSRVIDCIDPNVAFFFTASIDLTGASGTVIAVNKTLDDQQAFNSRLCSEGNPHSMPWTQTQTITGSTQDSPGVGQMTLQMSSSVTSYVGGDDYKVLSDTGVVISGVLVSVNSGSNEIVLDDTTDLSLVTGEKLANCCGVSLYDVMQRANNAVSGAADCVDDYDGNCLYSVFETTQDIITNSSRPQLSGRHIRKGDAGTRALFTDGAANTEIIFTSLILNTNGNSVSVEILAAAGLGVTVSGNFPNIKVSVNNNSGAATVADIIGAIHGDPESRRVIQATTGGNGTGIVSALAETDLVGGLDDATNDYAELLDENGDNKIISLNILKSDRRRFNKPPEDSEWLRVEYKC